MGLLGVVNGVELNEELLKAGAEGNSGDLMKLEPISGVLWEGQEL